MPVLLRGIILAGALLTPLTTCAILRAEGVRVGSAAVLPFTNLSPASTAPAPSSDWIAVSIAESVREALTAEGLGVASRADVLQAYTDLHLRPGAELTRASILKLGQVLSVENLIYGTFRAEQSGLLSIEVSMTDRLRSRMIGQLQENGTITEIDRMEGRLALQVIRMVMPAVALPESDAQTLRPPVRAAAEESFIRGLLATTPDLKERLYQQAVRTDARFARPILELGKIDLARKNYKGAAIWFAKIEATDLHYAEATFFFGVAKFYDGDFVAAQAAFDRITKSLPTVEVFNNLGVAESRLNLAHAIVSFRTTIDLDPSNPDYQFNLGYALLKNGQFDAAADRFRAVLARNPGDQMATLLLGRSIKREALRTPNPADARFETAERFKDTYELLLPRPAVIAGENK